MRRVIVTDIFGYTSALKSKVAGLAGPTEILSPYDQQDIPFKDEQDAYQYFSEHVGLDKYTHKLAKHIDNLQAPVSLLGFSVGASAIWSLSSQFAASYVHDAQLFYSSQIRNLLDIEPQFPTHIVFPARESHFEVDEVISVLIKKSNVSIEKHSCLHGFINPASVNFDAAASEAVWKKLKNHPYVGRFAD